MRVDRLGVEQRWVQDRAGTLEQRWCLVVRASHEARRPLWARVEALGGLAGQEHRHYLDAGRYVGLFWPASAEEEEARRLAASVTEVRLIAAGPFKKEAGEQRHEADFADLVSPASTPPRPEPVLVWP